MKDWTAIFSEPFTDDNIGDNKLSPTPANGQQHHLITLQILMIVSNIKKIDLENTNQGHWWFDRNLTIYDQRFMKYFAVLYLAVCNLHQQQWNSKTLTWKWRWKENVDVRQPNVSRSREECL